MKKKLICTLCCIVAYTHYPLPAAAAEPYGSGWYGEAQLAVLRNDNLTRSHRATDVLNDVSTSLTIGGGHFSKTGARGQLKFTGYLTATHQDKYPDLSRLATSVGIEYVHQPNPGFGSTWYRLSGDVVRFDYRDSDLREGYLFGADVGLSRRLSDRITGRLGARYANFTQPDMSDAEEAAAEAFDVAHTEAYLGVDYEIRRNLVLYAEYSSRRGDFTASVSGSAGWGIQYDAVSRDHLFHACTAAGCTPYYAYRSHGRTDIGDLGVAFQFLGQSFDLTSRYYESESSGGITYRDWVVQLAAMWVLGS